MKFVPTPFPESFIVERFPNIHARCLEYGIDMGSLTAHRQLQSVRSHIDDALARGATLLAGGHPREDLGPLFHEPTVHLQGVSEAYDHYGADDNHGCHWSDPELGIEWPFEPTTLSERAAGFGSLADLRARVSGASLDRPAT